MPQFECRSANINLDGAFVESAVIDCSSLTNWPSLQFLDSHEARSDTILVDVDVSILDPDE